MLRIFKTLVLLITSISLENAMGNTNVYNVNFEYNIPYVKIYYSYMTDDDIHMIRSKRCTYCDNIKKAINFQFIKLLNIDNTDEDITELKNRIYFTDNKLNNNKINTNNVQSSKQQIPSNNRQKNNNHIINLDRNNITNHMKKEKQINIQYLNKKRKKS